MRIDPQVLDAGERVKLALRGLYLSAVYSRYRMSKFEEYDLYRRYRDFLVSDRVITFTDTGGGLKALRPDVTLSIIKNTQDRPESFSRLCYDENVYRVSAHSGEFREIPQAGVECIGPVDECCLREVLGLAVKSLQLLGRECVLAVSDLTLIAEVLSLAAPDKEKRDEWMTFLTAKNEPALRLALGEGAETPAGLLLRTMAGLHGQPEAVLGTLREKAEAVEKNGTILERIDLLSELFAAFPEETAGFLELDFSVAGSLRYYSGLYFQGFVSGVPERVLSGGQYDPLMRAMGRRSRAVGFAVYPDTLERLPLFKEEI